ncbi:MAG TPA: glycosyltransferase family 9 protein [Holophagaceae bacterium]|nr:glycosyltransferase family 9 protein [Holophagaceae bacterium]
MRIALMRLSALGDILRVLPAWTNLHEAFPDARLQAVVEDRHAFLLEPFPWLEPVLVKRKALSHPLGALPELKRVAAELRGAEASLDFHGILKSAIIPKLAGIGERWGDGVTKEFAGALQTHRAPFRLQTRYAQALGLAEAFGASRGVGGLGGFRPVLKDAALPDCGAIWETSRPRAVLVPGASRAGAHKRWPLRHWLDLAARMKDRWELRWSLGPDEAELREWLPHESGVPALPPLPWWQLAAAVRQADRAITGDTGLLHLAVLLGVPVTALFGPSDPIVAGLPEGAGALLRTGIACSPCRDRACRRRQCLEELGPAQVVASV